MHFFRGKQSTRSKCINAFNNFHSNRGQQSTSVACFNHTSPNPKKMKEIVELQAFNSSSKLNAHELAVFLLMVARMGEI